MILCKCVIESIDSENKTGDYMILVIAACDDRIAGGLVEDRETVVVEVGVGNRK